MSGSATSLCRMLLAVADGACASDSMNGRVARLSSLATPRFAAAELHTPWCIQHHWPHSCHVNAPSHCPGDGPDCPNSWEKTACQCVNSWNQVSEVGEPVMPSIYVESEVLVRCDRLDGYPLHLHCNLGKGTAVPKRHHTWSYLAENSFLSGGPSSPVVRSLPAALLEGGDSLLPAAQTNEVICICLDRDACC